MYVGIYEGLYITRVCMYIVCMQLSLCIVQVCIHAA